MHSVKCCELRSIGTELRKLRAREREGQLSCGVFALHAVVCQASSFLQTRGSSKQRQAKPAQQASKQALAHSVATAKAELKRRAKKKK